MTALRKSHRVFSRGTPEMLSANAAQPGALAWKMVHGKAIALVVMNSAEHEVLLDNLATGLPAGTRLKGLYGLHGTPAAVVVGRDGRITLRLPARSGQVWRPAGRVRRWRTKVRPSLCRPCLQPK